MKVLLVNGSHHEKGCTYTALAEVAKALNANGVETEFISLAVKKSRAAEAVGLVKKSRSAYLTTVR